MHERVRDVFAEVYRKQGIDRDFYDSTLVKLYTDEGLVGSADALLNVSDSLGSVPKAESICRSLVGRSPWEFLHDDALGGILMAIYDLVGQAAGLTCFSLVLIPAQRADRSSLVEPVFSSRSDGLGSKAWIRFRIPAL